MKHDLYQNCTAALLAGGPGSRFGEEKASFICGGKPLASYGLEFLQCHFRQVFLCGPAKGLDIKTLPDRYKGCGPLAGIEAALSAAQTDWLFTLAADMPFPKQEVLFHLWNNACHSKAWCIVPSWSGGLEPLFAFYRRDSLAHLRKMINEGIYSIRQLFKMVETELIDLEKETDLLHLMPECFFNINTRQDLTAFKVAARLTENLHSDNRWRRSK